MAIVFEKPMALTDAVLHFCPGCPHGIIHRLVAEAIDELGFEGKTIGVAPVGCAVMAYDYFSVDMIEAIKLATQCKKPVGLCNRTGGMIPSPDQVLESIKNATKGVY